jgi:hypothetical protein
MGFFDWVSLNHPEPASPVYGDGPDGDRLRSQLVAERVALELVEEWERTINLRDLDGFMTLYAEDSLFNEDDKAYTRDFFGWRIGLNAHYEASDCQQQGDTIACTWTTSDDFFQTAGVPFLTGTMTFTIRDGLITRHDDSPGSASVADWNRVLSEFDTWVQDTHPELMDSARHGFVVFTADAAELQLQLVQEWMKTP